MSKLKWWQPYLLASVFTLTGASVVGAQDAEPQEPAAVQETEQILELGELRVVGSRVAGRSAQDSPVPVDVIQGEDLQTYGIRDMDSLLSATVPSYNVSQEPISDEATFVRPATLRGLPPDSTLVLVNGKRRHRGSVINFLGAPNSRGSQGADISNIPSIALERVEVLRDGAAAQYGSDAIAGVLNFRLREDTEGLTVQTSYGQNYHGDGDKVNVAANLGVPLTENGFANLSFEFNNVDETSRSVQRSDARGLIEAGNMDVRRPAAQIWGAPEIQYDYKFFGNLGLDLEEINSRVYAFGNYAERKVEGGFYFRNPNTRNGGVPRPRRPPQDYRHRRRFRSEAHLGGRKFARKRIVQPLPRSAEAPGGRLLECVAARPLRHVQHPVSGRLHPTLRRLCARLEHRLWPARDAGGPGGRLCSCSTAGPTTSAPTSVRTVLTISCSTRSTRNFWRSTGSFRRNTGPAV